MTALPPGSAKSTFASILFPPWYLGHAPGDRLARSRNILAPSLGLVEVRDLASRLLAEAAPQRGLECGYAREKPELSNEING